MTDQAPKKKRGRPRKPPTITIETPREEVQEQKPEPVKLDESYGHESLFKVLGENFDEVFGLVKKFETQFGIRLKFEPRFFAFRCIQGGRHVDWISLNHLMQRYDCRVPPIQKPHPQCQRPYNKNRIY